MKKIFVLVFISLHLQFTFAQDKILIHFDRQIGQVTHYYINNPDGIFILDYSGDLKAIILGNFTTEQSIIQAINDKTFNRISKQFVLGNVPLYAYNLREVIYPNDYANIEDAFKNYPTRINGLDIQYYDSYYDDKSVKGRIKKIGQTNISYLKSYYLPDQIKGKIKKIGQIEFELLNEFYRPETIGFIKRIGDVNIKYAHNLLHKELNNKVIQIGQLHISYYDDLGHQNHIGMFKKITGKDNRFLLLQ